MGSWKIDPMWRRCGWYLVGGMVATIPLLWWARFHDQQQPDLVPLRMGGTFTGVALLFVAWLNHVRIRLDDEGLHRRLFLRWDHWPWEDFAAGHIQFVAEAGSFRDPRRPWWRRGVCVAFLSDMDRQHLVEAVLARWRAPAPEPGETLEFSLRHRLFWRMKVRLDHAGVAVEDRRGAVYARWCQVESVWVMRHCVEQPDFRTLRLVLPERDIVLWRHIEDFAPRHHWRGANGTTILAFLQRCLPPEKVHIGHLTGEPSSVEDLVLRACVLRRRLRQGYWNGAIMAALCVGAAVLGLVRWDRRAEALFWAGMLLFALATMAFAVRSHRRELAGHKTRLSETFGGDAETAIAVARYALPKR